jgi:Ala-tRNA(Pro) deacylase
VASSDVGSVTQRLLALLAAEGADHVVLQHAPVRTSEEAAAIRGTPLEQGAKALVFQADERTVLLVVQAHRRLDTRAFKRAYGIKNLRMLPADDLLTMTGLEPGAVPPFGSLLGFSTYADEGLLRMPRLVFNAGNRSVSVLLATADYVRVEQPAVGRFASGE